MPTVLRVGGLRVVVYPNDHRPPHVHVIGSGCEASFRLDCPAGPVRLRENYGFSPNQIAAIAIDLQRQIGKICSEWERIHGVA